MNIRRFYYSEVNQDYACNLIGSRNKANSVFLFFQFAHPLELKGIGESLFQPTTSFTLLKKMKI